MQDRISSCIQDAVYNFERLLADNEVQYTIEQIVLQVPNLILFILSFVI